MSQWHDEEEQSESRPITVTQLNQHLRSIVEATFPSLWVAGEVSDLATPSSGHLYFTLKDDQSQVRAVIWRSTATRLPFKLHNGQQLLCFGSLEVYSVRGTYQIVVRRAQPQGLGSLQIAFEKLKAQLHSEGLFSAARKRDLPRFPSRIAVITSASGAAIHDFLVAAGRRVPASDILVIPAQVQGAGSAETIVRGLKAAAMIWPRLDVVVVTRGGGSLEDLWTFNEESVVRAIAECPVPTVSAIGHEVDVTLSDLAADLRALTPTDAAIKVFTDRALIADRVDELGSRLSRSAMQTIAERRARLESAKNHPVFKRPDEWIHQRSRYVDELENRSRRAIERACERAEAQLSTVAARLATLSPLRTLARGYGVTRNSEGDVILSADQIHAGESLETIVHRGRFSSTVTSIVPEESTQPDDQR
ncbi:MAG: exodeoxyribonuclease VII large subunit [Planctomycetota bacterium]